MSSEQNAEEFERKIKALTAQNERLRSRLRRLEGPGETPDRGPSKQAGRCFPSRQDLLDELEELHRAQAVARTGSWRLDVRRNELLWSDENHRIFGIPKHTPMTYETFLSTVHPEDRDYVDRKWNAALRGDPYDIEHRIVVDGTVKWIRERAELEFDPEGSLLGGFGTSQDITDLKNIEAQLQQTKEQFRIMGESVDYGVWLCNPDGGVEYVSQSFLELVNMTLEEVRGFGWVKRLVPDDVDAMLKNWRHCLQTGKAWDSEHRIVDRHGRMHTILTRGKPVHDKDGNITSWAGINLDITARKEAEKALQKAHDKLEEKVRLRTVKLEGAVRALENEMAERSQAEIQLRMLSRVYMDAADPIVIEDLGATILDMNREAERAYGWHRSELIGKSVLSIIPSERHRIAKQLRRRCRSGEEIRDWEGKREDKFGCVFPVLISAFPLMDESGETIAIASIAKDITLRKQMESELKKSHKRMRELSHKTVNALEADRKTVSKELHDSIGGSLAAIKFQLEGLLADLRTEESAQRFEGYLQRTISHLTDTIKETKRISANLRPLTLDDLGLIATVNAYARSFAEIYQDIRIDTQVHMQESDVPEMLKIVVYRVLQEALANVAKHSRADTVCVHLDRSQDIISMRIEDNGCGIAAESPFRAGNSLSGYGLKSMQERVEICGGVFSLRSKPGQGTCIRITLPAGQH